MSRPTPKHLAVIRQYQHTAPDRRDIPDLLAEVDALTADLESAHRARRGAEQRELDALAELDEEKATAAETRERLLDAEQAVALLRGEIEVARQRVSSLEQDADERMRR